MAELSVQSPTAPTILGQIQGAMCRLSAWIGDEEPLAAQKSSNIISELLATPLAQNALHVVEKSLDNYIARISEWVRSQRRQLGVSNSSSWWLRWAFNRSLTVNDARSKKILTNIIGGLDELFIIEEYLRAYDEERFLRPTPLSEVAYRWRTLFGTGWFFEWPGGRNPLNSTWPWTDVRPALCVLWGVCWMFYEQIDGLQQLFEFEIWEESLAPGMTTPLSISTTEDIQSK